MSITSYSQQTPPVNYLHTPVQLSFDNTAYGLTWSSHPTTSYYKQEYLPKGESLNKFNNLLLLELVSSALTPKGAFDAKVAELTAMKKSNPYVSFESFHHAASGEYVLDFVVTANSPDGKEISIAERNVYRYKTYTGPNKETGVILFGVSKRSYGAEAKKFVTGLTGSTRQALVSKVQRFVFPVMSIR